MRSRNTRVRRPWVLLASPRIEWLPRAADATSLFGAFLAAQAAIAALSLAVVLFALERVSARPDVDDRVLAEYVRRSRMWPCSSVVSLWWPSPA